MKRFIKERWNDDKLQNIAVCFGTAVDALTMLDGSESFVCEYECDGKADILRSICAPSIRVIIRRNATKSSIVPNCVGQQN